MDGELALMMPESHAQGSVIDSGYDVMPVLKTTSPDIGFIDPKPYLQVMGQKQETRVQLNVRPRTANNPSIYVNTITITYPSKVVPSCKTSCTLGRRSVYSVAIRTPLVTRPS